MCVVLSLFHTRQQTCVYACCLQLTEMLLQPGPYPHPSSLSLLLLLSCLVGTGVLCTNGEGLWCVALVTAHITDGRIPTSDTAFIVKRQKVGRLLYWISVRRLPRLCGALSYVALPVNSAQTSFGQIPAMSFAAIVGIKNTVTFLRSNAGLPGIGDG